jgi:hypothetical protein
MTAGDPEARCGRELVAQGFDLVAHEVQLTEPSRRDLLQEVGGRGEIFAATGQGGDDRRRTARSPTRGDD